MNTTILLQTSSKRKANLIFSLLRELDVKAKELRKSDVEDIEDAAFLSAMEASLATGLADTSKVLAKIKSKCK